MLTDAQSPTIKSSPAMPVLEINSPASGDGKSHLLLLLIAIAIIPVTHGGSQACVALFDLSGTFSASRLSTQLRACFNNSQVAEDDGVREELIASCLDHVHVFKPQSLASCIATLEHLPEHMLHSMHPSRGRRLALIALDSASAFYWQARAHEEDTAFQRDFGSSSPSAPTREQSGSYITLTAALKTASLRLNSAVVLTTSNIHPIAAPQIHQADNTVRALRPSLPLPLSTATTLKVLVQRQRVRKFPVSISVREALRESTFRQAAADEAKFVCAVNEWGLDPRTLERIGSRGLAFQFTIKEQGVEVVT